MTVIKSISYDQSEIIKNILKLYVPDERIDVDSTYSRGYFYKNTGIAEPRYKFDISPQSESVSFGDSRNLPLPGQSVQCMMFDPPFLATTGKSLNEDTGNIINRRFGVYASEHALHQFYVDSLTEAHRVLKPNGILIFKCQDKVSSGKQYMSHVFIANAAVKAGFYPKDLFILLAKSRLVANWQAKNQKHARKYNAYFWVFEKSSKRIQYLAENTCESGSVVPGAIHAN